LEAEIRSFLDAILAFIETATLTDEEFESLEVEEQVYTQEVYEALLAVLDERETVSTTRDRLEYYFLARGVEVEASSVEAKSNVYLGSSL
jgi:hypothetical protein